VFQTVKNAWRIPELKKKLLFVVFAILIFRLGAAIPVPFINTALLEEAIAARSGTIFGLLNTLSGSSFSHATVFALSVQPYINSSIIIQLLTIAIPALERMQKDEGEEGRKKIAAITRYTTVAIGLLQGFGYYTLIRVGFSGTSLLEKTGLWPAIVIVLSFTAGSAFIMWLGEQINEFGIGNGISIILFAGIISRVPSMIVSMVTGVQRWMNPADATSMTASQLASYNASKLHPAFIPFFIVGMLLLVIFIVFITNAERRIPVQYAKRVVGRKMYGGQSTHIPMKVNMSGVLPIIFAQAIASLPATIGMFVPSSQVEGTGWYKFLNFFNTTSVAYMIVYALLIVGFSYFYATVQFNPIEIANNLKKNGGFIPGFRPGKPTSEFISKVLSKITFFGAIFLMILALLPIITGRIIGISALSIGGTSIIIVVGVALETVKALESQMLMRHYKGFLE